MKHCCELMVEYLANEDNIIDFDATFREYGIPVHDGGSSEIVIRWCPWCGTRLPSSLRDRWFDEIEALGFEIGDPGIPERFRSDAWWRSAE